MGACQNKKEVRKYNKPGQRKTAKKMHGDCLSEELLKRQLNVIFDKYDVDGNGELSKDEARNMLRDLCSSRSKNASEEYLD